MKAFSILKKTYYQTCKNRFDSSINRYEHRSGYKAGTYRFWIYVCKSYLCMNRIWLDREKVSDIDKMLKEEFFREVENEDGKFLVITTKGIMAFRMYMKGAMNV